MDQLLDRASEWLAEHPESTLSLEEVILDLQVLDLIQDELDGKLEQKR